jgi:hypothetical protein
MEIFMKLRKLIGSLLVTTMVYGISTLANAEDVTLSNQSKYALSFNMNNDPTKVTGVISAGSTQTIDEASFKEFCVNQSNHCELEIFMPYPNKELAKIIFEGTTIISVSNNVGSDIRVTGHGSHVVFENK